MKPVEAKQSRVRWPQPAAPEPLATVSPEATTGGSGAPPPTAGLPAWPSTRVTKSMWPPRPGTVKFTELHGPALVCVRYRQDPHGLCRYTTVEVVVNAAYVNSARARKQRLHVPIAYEEAELRAHARRLGAKWLADSRVWELSGHAVQQLHLTHRVRNRRQK